MTSKLQNLSRHIIKYFSSQTRLPWRDSHTCLGRAGAPPYHWNRAFHRESGTNSKSRHLTSIRFRFNLPPSPVSVTTLQAGVATRTVLSMGPGAGGGPTEQLGTVFLGCRGEWLGLDVTLGGLKNWMQNSKLWAFTDLMKTASYSL